MPDTFDRLGVFGVARASRLQRVRRRRAAASSVSAGSDAGRCASSGADSAAERCPGDVAIDFVDVAAIVRRMQSAFFSGQS
ncbi:MAG: hypothetical protein ACM4AI_13605 [Acidobacteriota bacterium]